jgi:hypothetical protein
MPNSLTHYNTKNYFTIQLKTVIDNKISTRITSKGGAWTEHVKAKIVVKGFKRFAGLTTLIDVGSPMTVVDRGLAEVVDVDVEYTDRRVAIVKELIVEDKPLKF